MSVQVQTDNIRATGSIPGSTAAETAPDGDALQREVGSASAVLQPDVTFGAPPLAHILHVIAFAACSLTSIVCLVTQLPIKAGSTYWWPVFSPQLVFPIVSIVFHSYSILPAIQRRAIRMQLGDSPDPSTTNSGAILQHQLLERVFRKTYIASNCSDISLYVSILSAVIILFIQLETRRGTAVSWKMVGLPIALGGLAAVILQTLYRVRNRGAFPTISTRSDFAVIFVFLAAYKLDRDSLSWTITFIFLFWWIIAFVLLGLAGLLVYHAGRRAHLWSRIDLNVRLGVSLVHLSYMLLLVSAAFLFKLLRGGGPQEKPYKLSSTEGAQLLETCLATTAAWVVLSSMAQVAVFRGQKQREDEREAQIRDGRVWTRWTANPSSEMATIVRQVDALSPEEIIRKASDMMQGVSRPARLYRLEANLWSTAPKPSSSSTAVDAPGTLGAVSVDTAVDKTGAQADLEGLSASGSLEAEATQAGTVVPGHVSVGAGTCCDEVAVNISALSQVNPPTSMPAGSSEVGQTDVEKSDISCVICFEDVGDHVMMPCGHGGYCRHCAHKLYVRPPNLCPICRSRLESVVKVSIDTPIGMYTGVL